LEVVKNDLRSMKKQVKTEYRGQFYLNTLALQAVSLAMNAAACIFTWWAGTLFTGGFAINSRLMVVCRFGLGYIHYFKITNTQYIKLMHMIAAGKTIKLVLGTCI